MRQWSYLRRTLLLLAVLAIANPHAEAWTPPWQPTLLVTAVMPTSGPPTGGSFVRLSGRGFVAPVRVFFELDGTMIEAFVVSVSEMQLELLTPPVAFGPDEQMRVATITVESGGHRVTAPDAYLFENPVQTPKVFTATPNSGSKQGGTRVTIFGEGFQQPVQVLFGDAEARVLYVMRDQIIVESPPASELGAVGITVRNINSQTEGTLADAYRYALDPALISVVPNHGRPGMNITINGVGFNAPVAVTFAGIAAQVISVSGTRIIARPQPPPTCASFTGPVAVINIADGAIASGIDFSYEAEGTLAIAAINPRVVVAGRTVAVQLERAGDVAFEIGGAPAEVLSRFGTTFRLRVPTTLAFATGACTFRGVEGTGPVTSNFDLRVIDRSSGCSTTRRDALTITPATPVACTLPPLATVLPRTCASRTVTFANEHRRANLVITAPASVEPRSAIIPAGGKAVFTLTPAAQLERFRFETNDPLHPWLLVCVSP